MCQPKKNVASFPIKYEGNDAFFIKIIERNQGIKDKQSFQCKLESTESERNQPIRLYRTKHPLPKHNFEEEEPFLTECNFDVMAEIPGTRVKHEIVKVCASVKENDVNFSLDISLFAHS